MPNLYLIPYDTMALFGVQAICKVPAYPRLATETLGEIAGAALGHQRHSGDSPNPTTPHWRRARPDAKPWRRTHTKR